MIFFLLKKWVHLPFFSTLTVPMKFWWPDDIRHIFVMCTHLLCFWYPFIDDSEEFNCWNNTNVCVATTICDTCNLASQVLRRLVFESIFVCYVSHYIRLCVDGNCGIKEFYPNKSHRKALIWISIWFNMEEMLWFEREFSGNWIRFEWCDLWASVSCVRVRVCYC